MSRQESSAKVYASLTMAISRCRNPSLGCSVVRLRPLIAYLVGLLTNVVFAAEPPPTVVGRTQDAWVAELTSSNPVARRRAVLSLGAFGPSAVPTLTQALSQEDFAVRYWAASELGDLGEAASSAGEELRRMLSEKSIGLRMSAAYALCRIGQVEAGLPTLLEGLRHDERGVWNLAGDFLARVGPPAKAAIQGIEQASKRDQSHIPDICNEALRRIRDTDQPLPSATVAPLKDNASRRVSGKALASIIHGLSQKWPHCVFKWLC